MVLAFFPTNCAYAVSIVIKNINMCLLPKECLNVSSVSPEICLRRRCANFYSVLCKDVKVSTLCILAGKFCHVQINQGFKPSMECQFTLGEQVEVESETKHWCKIRHLFLHSTVYLTHKVMPPPSYQKHVMLSFDGIRHTVVHTINCVIQSLWLVCCRNSAFQR